MVWIFIGRYNDSYPYTESCPFSIGERRTLGDNFLLVTQNKDRLLMGRSQRVLEMMVRFLLPFVQNARVH